MKLKNSFLILVLIFLCTQGNAQIRSFLYSKKLQDIQVNWNALSLPEDVYPHSVNDLKDLRIYGILKNKDTIEAPYVLVGFKEKASPALNFSLINSAVANGGKYYSFKTDSLLALSALSLEFNKPNYDIVLQLQGSHDQVQWFTITDSARVIAFSNNYTSFSYSHIHFPVSQYKWYRIFIPGVSDIQLQNIKTLQHIPERFTSYPIKNLRSKVDVDKENKESTISITLPDALPVNSFKISVQNKTEYYRPITLEQVTDSFIIQGRTVFQYTAITTGLLVSGKENIFSFPAVIGKAFRIVLYNADNEPLQIDSVTAFAPDIKILTRISLEGNYFLAYGNKNMGEPEYDISKFPIPAVDKMHAITAGKENAMITGEKNTPIVKKYWLWVVLVFLGILLAAGVWIMIRQKNSKDNKIGASE